MEEYNKLRSGYRGGHVDVYRPYGRNLFYYDVNALYPSQMQTKLFPTDIILKFIGDNTDNSDFSHYGMRSVPGPRKGAVE